MNDEPNVAASGDDPPEDGKAVSLRPVEESDVEDLLRMLGEPTVRRWWGEYSRRDVIRDFLNDPSNHSMVIEVAGRVAGAVQYSEDNDPDYRHASIDVFLSERWQGHGYGPEALKLLASHLFNSLGHHRITIDPATTNAPAIRAYEKVGFRAVGVMRQYERGPDDRWHDSLLMDLLAQDLESSR